jgi:hypothetical protein
MIASARKRHVYAKAVKKIDLRFLLALIVSTAVASGSAQWLHAPTPGTPRLSNGKPNLDAPVPRTPDGKPDLSGVWQLNRRDFAKHGSLSADRDDVPFRPMAEEIYRKRLETFGVEDPLTRCLPPGTPRIFADPFAYKIAELPGMVLILYESGLMFRQLFTDGRTLPSDPMPTWMGYSVAHWEGDVLVATSAGFNGRTWLDSNGHPTSDALRVTERFERRNFGRMDLSLTIDDAKMYTRPWTSTLRLELLPDTDLIEYFCLENEKDLQHLVGK